MATPPPAEELLKKIHVLEEGQENLKQEMSKLRHTSDAKSEHPRSHSVSPQRSRFSTLPNRRVAGGGGGDAAAWKKGSTSFRHSSPLQRESRSHDPPTGGGGGDDFRGGGGSGPSAVNFTDRQYLNILQSIGQSVHIFDPHGRIIYW